MRPGDSGPMTLAEHFLDRFRARSRGAAPVVSPITLFADDVEGFAAAVADDPDGLARAMDEASERVDGSTADLVPGSFASAACDADGRILVADEYLQDRLDMADALQAAAPRVTASRPSLSLVAHDASDRPVAIAIAHAATAASWPLSAEVRARLDRGDATMAVLAFRPDRAGWARVARAYRLTPAETRLLATLAHTGDLQDAAATLDIAYETARKLLASAMDRAGASRQTDLVSAGMRLAAGDVRTPDNVTRLFAELFALTLRQARTARAVAMGATRDQAAEALGMSAHAVKADLKQVYLACGVKSAVDLARTVTEVDALAGLATACDVAVNPAAVEEPLRMIRRTWAAGSIAVADHGPPGGAPVVILHTTTMGRAISPRFIAALQGAGLRPIIFDRAGYGLTDHVPGDPHASFARDAGEVLAALGYGRAILLSRGMAMSAVTAAALAPATFTGGVLLNPEPPAAADGNRRGMMGAARALTYKQPWMVEGMARLLSRRTDSAAIARLVRASVEGSAVDLAALDDPAEMAVMVRSARQCALGMHGFVNETVTHASGKVAPPLPSGTGWTILHGALDPLYDFDDAAPYWRATLPGAKVERIPGGGRYLHLTHPRLIAQHCAARAA